MIKCTCTNSRRYTNFVVSLLHVIKIILKLALHMESSQLINQALVEHGIGFCMPFIMGLTSLH